jgi:deferrochelatase/peroxidase EfeB
MHAIRIACTAAAEQNVTDAADRALEDRLQAAGQVQTGLNLVLPLKNPAQMQALIDIINEKATPTHAALLGLHYVHFARFLPTLDGSSIIIITVFDGDLKSYIMDFVAVLGDIFTAILEFVEGAPRLPVQKYPQDFWNFIQQHNVEKVQPWSAYPQMTVIDIQGPRRTLPRQVSEPAPAELQLDDIQGNILRGYRAHFARHFALEIGEPGAARQFVAALVSGNAAASPQITTAALWQEHPAYCLNLGFTSDGLKTLGLPDATWNLFPEAFRKGPADARKASLLGDTCSSEPSTWVLGQPGAPVHMLLSLFIRNDDAAQLELQSGALRQLFSSYRLQELSCHDAAALRDGRVHFGYKDGIAQPRIAGAPGDSVPDMQPAAGAGEFLLGKNYVNQYGGNFIGDIPSALGDNATYAALRILEQDVVAFEALLTVAALRSGMDRELIAAKLMGRWRDGTPLAVSPDKSLPTMPAERLNEFDYAPSAKHPAQYDDAEGLRCPVGSHIRRLNPRGALVKGKPYSRRIIRRGMPYGPAFDPLRPDGIKRGLIGLFICGDIEMQFEFLQCTWANQGVATLGIRNTRDPILGAQPKAGGKFVIPTGDPRDSIELYVPRLINTRGSVYLFVPGIGGLRYLASL